MNRNLRGGLQALPSGDLPHPYARALDRGLYHGQAFLPPPWRVRSLMPIVQYRILGACLIAAFVAATVARAEPAAAARAVEAGLRRLAVTQRTEGPQAGSWDCPRPEYRPATAALAGLAFLANGSTPAEGPYAAEVRRTLDYLLPRMGPDGYVGQGDPSGMYIHAIALQFALGCVGMTGDERLEADLARWCERAIAVIEQAQGVRRGAKERGGWRYTPGSNESDLSVTSWQLLALHAARQCGFEVRDEVIAEALAFVRSAYLPLEPGKAGYVYRPGISREPEPSVTGVALCIRAILDRPDEAQTAAALAYLESFPPAWGGDQYKQFYFLASFYLAQGMFQVGGPAWERHRSAVEEVLVVHQAGDGSWPFPADNAPQTRLAGPAYPTALAILMLSLDKQYLPVYQRQRALY